MKKFIFITILFFSSISIFSQENSSVFNISADVVNRFIFRGMNVGGSSAHIQPLVYYTKSNIEIGAFGSYGLSNQYEEVDLYAKYYIKDFYLTYTDYYIPVLPDGSAMSINNKFFNFNNKTTSHNGEITFGYKRTKSFPISLNINMFIFGNDKNYGYDAGLDTTSGNYYSTYIELGYTIKISDKKVDLFAGLTPEQGLYGDKFGFVNVGLKGYKDIQISDKLTIPAYVVLTTNPQKESIFFVFGITL